MPAYMVKNELVCVTPAMATDTSIYAGSIYAEQRVSGKYDLSYEMVDFLAKLARGTYEGTDSSKRCVKIATRKGCYPQPLINGFGILSEEGEEAANDAKILQSRIIRYYQYIGSMHPSVDQAKTMDEIVVYGNLPIHSIRVMQFLWNLIPEDLRTIKSDAITPMPYNWNMEVFPQDGENYVLMSSIRNNMYTRVAVDRLTKFGLVDLVNLPKLPASRGKGRAPVGFSLNDAGIRFYHNYLQTFDPKAKFQAYMSEPPPPDFGKVRHDPIQDPADLEASSSPDIVDGEDLRDLFG